MGKLIKNLFRFIVFIIVLIIAFVGFCYYMIYDATDDTPSHLYNNTITFDDEMSKIIDNALSSNDDTFSFSISQDQLDLLIFGYVRQNLNEDYLYSDESAVFSYQFDSSITVLGGREMKVKSVYTEMTENSLTIYSPVEILGIKSRISVGFTLSEANGVYTFTLSRLGFGKINLMSGFGKKILNQILIASNFTDDSINNELSDLPFKFKLSDFSLEINKEEFGDYIVKKIVEDDNSVENELITELIGILSSKDNNLLEIKFYSINNSKHFGIVLNLQDIKHNPLTDGNPTYQLNYDDYSAKMESLLNGTNSEFMEENFELISKFIIYGYSKLDDNEKLIVDAVDFSIAGINNNQSYLGLIPDFDDDLDDYISNQIYQQLSNLTSGEINIEISEDLINKIIFKASDLIGVGFNTFYQKDDNYKLFYSGVESMWVDIVDGELGFKILYNLNNTRICLFTSFTNESTSNAKIEANFEELRLGNIEFSESMREIILNLLNDALDGDNSQIIKIVDKKIVIDSEKFLEEFKGDNPLSDLLDILQENEMITLSLIGVSLDDNGKISFKISLDKIENNMDLTKEINEAKQDFDVNAFIQSKTQTFVISNLSNEDTKIIFSKIDFNKLLYKETQGFNDFKNVTTLPDNSTEFVYQVVSILVDFAPSNVSITFIIDINGFETAIVLNGAVTYNNDQTEIYISLLEDTKLGSINLETNDFIINILGNNINNFGLMDYDSVDKKFIIKSDIFQDFMNIGGDSTPLTVQKLNIINGALEVYVDYDDPALSLAIDLATQALEAALGNDFLNPDDFNTADETQQQALDDLTDNLAIISQIISDPNQTLDSENTDNLINAINQLSEENQQIFFNQLETQASSDDLTSLYDILFGN